MIYLTESKMGNRGTEDMLTKLEIHYISLKTLRVPQGYSNMFTLDLGL